MIRLVNGPCEGAYAVKRAPIFLRAVLHTLTGDKDVLDQVDDTPGDDEEVCVYKLKGEAGVVHFNRGKGRSGFYATGTYHHQGDVVGADLRETMRWRRWVADQLPYLPIDLETGAMT